MIESAILHFFYHASFEIAAKFASGYKKNVRLDYRFCETLRLIGQSQICYNGKQKTCAKSVRRNERKK